MYLGDWPTTVGGVLSSLGIVLTAAVSTRDWVRQVTDCFGELGIDLAMPIGPQAAPSVDLGNDDLPWAGLEVDDTGVEEVCMEEDLTTGRG